METWIGWGQRNGDKSYSLKRIFFICCLGEKTKPEG